MAYDQDLLDLEASTLEAACGDWLRAIDAIRTLIAMDSPSVAQAILALGVPTVEATLVAGITAAHKIGASHALDMAGDLNLLEEVAASHVVRAQPPTKVVDPVNTLDDRIKTAHLQARILVQTGAEPVSAAAPLFAASNTVKSLGVSQINASANTASTSMALAVNLPLVWVAERDACVDCLALAGKVVTPGDAFPQVTYGAKIRYPATEQPPLHRYCRCYVELLNDQSYADALQREAQRSILRGYALPSESNAVRIKAASMLLDNPLLDAPKSVQTFARQAVKRGSFPNRQVPGGDPRLIIK